MRKMIAALTVFTAYATVGKSNSIEQDPGQLRMESLFKGFGDSSEFRALYQIYAQNDTSLELGLGLEGFSSNTLGLDVVFESTGYHFIAVSVLPVTPKLSVTVGVNLGVTVLSYEDDRLDQRSITSLSFDLNQGLRMHLSPNFFTAFGVGAQPFSQRYRKRLLSLGLQTNEIYPYLGMGFGF